MSDVDPYASCDGRPLLVSWRIDRHFFYSFEVDTEEVERLVPEPLQIVELRPGVAVMSVSLLRFLPGQVDRDSAGFFELVGSVHVAPDLSLAMPVSTMTFISFSVLSDSADFVYKNEGRDLYTPTRLTDLEVTIDDDRLAAAARTGEGPIFEMPGGHPEPKWAQREMWGQHFTDTRGVQGGIWQWEGRLFEHQRPLPGWKLHPHPFWAGIRLDRVRRIYRSMVLEPGTLCRERFYAMRLLTPPTG